MDSLNPFSRLDPSRNRPSLAGPSSGIAESGTASGNLTSKNKKKKHRAGRKHRRPRRMSFATLPEDDGHSMTGDGENPGARTGFYGHAQNLSSTSIDSEALLDHRGQPHGPRPRRPSALATSFSKGISDSQTRLRNMHGGPNGHGVDDDDIGEGTPLLSTSKRRESSDHASYGSGAGRPRLVRRSTSRSSTRRGLASLTPSSETYNINYPPSMPGSPQMGATDRLDLNFGDEMMREEIAQVLSGPNNLVGEEAGPLLQGSPGLQRRHTFALQAEDDVCYPQEGMSEIAYDDIHRSQDQRSYRRGRRRRSKWPDLSILEEWSRFEKEGRSEERKTKKTIEPQLINGRLRAVHKGWYRTEEDAPYRFTYFNEEFQTTIHSQTISELVQPETSFRQLFVPDPPVLSDSSSDEDADDQTFHGSRNGDVGASRVPSMATTRSDRPDRMSELAMSPKQIPLDSTTSSTQHSGEATPVGVKSPAKPSQPPNAQSPSPRPPKPARYGDRPVWWLDVLSPTEAEMKVIQKTFGIHPLTSEDIMMEEQREKVELFRHYYFVNYRSFDQDEKSETHLDPVNMYVVVFREGVISFHFSQTPHPANVRRRIRQLKDFMVLSADWISYAIIDDITDVFVPMIQNIEEEVDDIDDAILTLHSSTYQSTKAARQKDNANEKGFGREDTALPESDGDMLKRIGNCRKKVMELYRLLGNKADVIKGFAKRCNEHWEVAPRSEIGLYLGDIQDHIITMTGNLGHYEKILSRSHGNYLAQINIRMNERSEQTADTLGKLTVLGTIVLPMNIITGLWGMNVWVPGQEYEGSLTWFWCITAGLLMFGVACFLIAKRVYKIV